MLIVDLDDTLIRSHSDDNDVFEPIESGEELLKQFIQRIGGTIYLRTLSVRSRVENLANDGYLNKYLGPSFIYCREDNHAKPSEKNFGSYRVSGW